MSATANGVDPALVTRIVDRVKSQGIFDQFRRDCLADVDTKPAYQNLGTRVEGYVSSFLANFVWTPEMNKNQLRNSLRRQINGSEMLASGVERIIEQVVDAQIQHIFLPRIETVVKEYLHSDNASSSTSDVKTTEPTSKPGMESGPIPPQPGSSGASSSPMVLGVKGSPADSPLPGWSAATNPLQSSATFSKPPPLPGETQDQPQPPPLPDSSTAQEKPKPPPLPRSREASPPPLPPSVVPERKRTSSVSSTPSLDSISSDPLSIDSEEEKAKVVPKIPPPKAASPASSAKSTPGKATPGKVTPGKRRVILKKVVVRKADGTKVVRVVRMDPTKATAKRLLMRATSRATGEQGGSPKGKTISPAKVKTEEDKKQAEEEESPVKSIKLPEDDLSSDVPVSPLLGKRKHLPIDTKDIKVSEEHLQTSQVKAEPVSSEDEDWTPKPERPRRRGFSQEEIAAAHASSDSDEEYTPSPLVPKEEDSLSKDLEDVSSSGSDMDFEEGNSSNFPQDRRDFLPADASDSDSHVSDVTVSSVHTSDLSSFDDKISSSSSSSSSSEESEEEEEEDTDDYGKKLDQQSDQSSADTKPTSVLLASKGDPTSERSISPASSGGGKTSPRLVGEARWKRQHMVDAEDEETRAERRRRADTKVWIDQHHQAQESRAKKAEAKEERAKRRQQMKEERERERERTRSPSQLETRKQRRGRSEDEGAEGKLYTKQQLKEQKLQEKRREAKRQRSLLSQSDDGSAALDSNKPRRDTQWTPPPILRHEFFLKKRRDSQIPFHHLLTLDMDYKQLLKKSQQRAKYISMRAKEEKEGKKSYCRFNFHAPGTKARKSRWLQESIEQKMLKWGREEPSTSEAVLERSVTIDEADQQAEMQGDNEQSRLEMVSPASPAVASPGPKADRRDSPGLESINSPESEANNDEIAESNADAEPEPKKTDVLPESDGQSEEKVDTVVMDKIEVETELKVEKPNESTATDTLDVKMEGNESFVVSPSQVNIPSADTNIFGESLTGSDRERNINDEKIDAVTEEILSPEEHLDKEDAKLETEKGEQQENDEMDEVQEVDNEEEGQISGADDEKNDASAAAEDTVPTFVVLEREEISSEEGDFDDPDRDAAEEQASTKDESVKLPSIFQQTEAISSDEELDDIVPSPKKDTTDEDRVEEKSEGEVDEDTPPLAEGESITKLAEDISGDELSDNHSPENPPTPTMDEPSEFEGIREGSSDGKAAIPIVLVSNPNLGGSVKSLGHSYSSGSSSDAEGRRTREGTPKAEKIQEMSEDISKKEEIEEGELAEVEEGEVPEEKEQPSGHGLHYRTPSSQSDPPEEASGYGKRPRRRTFFPHQGKDDDYLYFGLPKRARRQSPTPAPSSPPPQEGAVQRKPLTRERSRSGGMSANQNKESPALVPSKEQEERVPSALMERRSSRYSRRVSPPRRYSPSEQRAAPKGKNQGNITPPSAPSPAASPQEPDQPSQPQQPHRHFTRRMSGRDEERRPHRYEDMYYYDNKRSRGNTSQAPAAGKPTRRTSAEDRKRKR